MRKYIVLCILLLLPAGFLFAQGAATVHESVVNSPHDFMKVRELYHPDSGVYRSGYLYLGELPVTWVNKSIGKKKMTAAMMGADVLYLNKAGNWEGWSTFTVDEGLLRAHLAEKSNFQVIDKLLIRTGPQAYESVAQKTRAELTGVEAANGKVYVTGKIPGESARRFRVTYVNATRINLCTDDKELTTYLIQVKG